MDDAARARLQVRLVLVVYRAESAKLKASNHHTDAAQEDQRLLQERSLLILDQARRGLDGSARWHEDALAEIASARAEIAVEA